MCPKRLESDRTCHQQVSGSLQCTVTPACVGCSTLTNNIAEAHLSKSRRIKNALHNPFATLASRIRPAHNGNPDNSGPTHGDRDDHSRHSIRRRFTAKRQPSLPPFNYHLNTTCEDSLREPFLARQLLVDFLKACAYEYYTLGQTRGNGGQASTSQGANGTNSLPFQGAWPPPKRKNNQRDDDDRRNKKPKDGPSDDPPDGEDSKKPQPGETDTEPELACPFYLQDRCTYARCRKFKFRSMADVKQHILRVHKHPLHCPICHRIFASGHEDAQSRGQKKKHVRQRNCVKSEKEGPGLTEAQVQQLKNTKGRPGKMRETWNDVWNILFPGVPHPESPYHTSSELEATVGDLLNSFWESGAGRDLPTERRLAMEECFALLADHIPIYEATPPLSHTAPEAPEAPAMPIPTQISIHQMPFPRQTTLPGPPSTTPTQRMRPTTSLHENIPAPISPTRRLAGTTFGELDPELGGQLLANMFPQHPPRQNPPWQSFPNNEDPTQHHNLDYNLPQPGNLTHMDPTITQDGRLSYPIADFGWEEFIQSPLDDDLASQMPYNPTPQDEGDS